MKIKKLELTKFCAFKGATFEFSPGINVIIGGNASGKSHLLKAMYCLLKSTEAKNGDSDLPYEKRAARKFQNVFRPAGSGFQRLLWRMRGRGTAKVAMETSKGNVSIWMTNPPGFGCTENTMADVPKTVFIPSREVLSWFKDLPALYENYQLYIDETYYDLCKALAGPSTRGPRAEKARQLVEPLEKIIEGTVFEENGIFYVRTANGQFEAHLLAEGWRKIASLCRLIQNGSLLQNAFLFWDEPEANLNPNLIVKIAETLRKLADLGIQIFITTHDYLLSSELSMIAETAQDKNKENIRFFCLNRHREKGIIVDTAPTIPLLENNPILDEFAAHYDRENSLFIR